MLRRLVTKKSLLSSGPNAPIIRTFSAGRPWQTDGVFRELTNQRVRVPWIEALRKQQAQNGQTAKSTGTQENVTKRDLTPRKMADSYHSVVCSEAKLLISALG